MPALSRRRSISLRAMPASPGTADRPETPLLLGDATTAQMFSGVGGRSRRGDRRVDVDRPAGAVRDPAGEQAADQRPPSAAVSGR